MRKSAILATLSALCLLASPAVSAPVKDDGGIADTRSGNFVSQQTLPNLSAGQLNAKVNDFDASLHGAVAKLDANQIMRQSRTVAGIDAENSLKMVSTLEVKTNVALVAAHWPASGPQPLVVLGRYLQGGAWSEWQTIGEEFETSQDKQSHATEPWVLTNVAKAQIAVVVPAGATIKPEVELISAETRQKDYAFASVEGGNTQAFVSAGVKPGTATGPDGNPEKPENGTGDSGDKIIPPDANAINWTKVPATGEPTAINSRSDWGADESWLGWRPRAGAVRGAVVHHTATGNEYSPGDVPAILRSIYRYHAISLGWGDIGYNVLVDNFGRAWQGRAGDVWTYNTVGAHASGVNSSTFGISVLGNYTDFRPSDAAVDAVARVVAFKLKPTGKDPLDLQTNITKNGADFIAPVVAGHRDVGATACPGNAFYAFLPEVRKMVKEYMSAKESPVAAPSYARAIETQQFYGIPLNLAGRDRIETSILIARYAFMKGTKVVYVARADNTADALAGGALTDGPIVLVNNAANSIRSVSNYISSSGADQVIALGGEGAVPADTLRAVAGKAKTSRLAGMDRGETSLKIAQRVLQQNPKMNRVYLAEQGQGVDALSAGSLTDGPVVLVPTEPWNLSAEVRSGIATLPVQTVVALGGPGAVSDSTLTTVAGKKATSRIAGNNRYETAIKISNYRFPKGSQRAYLASGSNPVDAVAGGVLRDGPVLLLPNARSATLNPTVGVELGRLGAIFVTALGGEGAVSVSQVKQTYAYTWKKAPELANDDTAAGEAKQ